MGPVLPLPSDADASGRTFGAEEMEQLGRVVASGTLNSTKGTAVREFERRFAARYGVPFARCASSGTAALQAAVAAVDPEPGDEIVTTPITDMGAIAAILYQGAVPVFADVDPRTYNVTAGTLARRLSARTRALVVTHLFGNPCAMDEIMALARRHRLPVIEDCAQAYLAEYGGALVGTLGDIGCFSLQQGKHLSAGEGGIVVTARDDYARRIRLFIDKAWGYGDPDPDHYFLAPNYRMTELQGAVALAQLEKVEGVVRARQAAADALTKRAGGLCGIETPAVTPAGAHVYWKYPLRVDPDRLAGGVDGLARFLAERGIACAPRYIKKPAFACRVIRERVTFGSSRWPWSARAPEPPVEREADYPGTVEALARAVVLPWNERYTDAHVAYIADQLRAASAALGGRE